MPDVLANQRTGLSLAISAFTLWGLAAMYFKAIAHVPAIEILAHRILWSVLLLASVITLRKQWPAIRRLNWHSIRPLLLGAIVISLNWLTFIWAISQNHILEASLGYYINPLVNVLFGMLFLGERLRKLQAVAILLALLGVVNQIMIVGNIPSVALILAFSFGIYSLIRKHVQIDPVIGLFMETLLLLPFAALYISWHTLQGSLVFGHLNLSTDLLLMCAGVITSLPLILFAAAASRLSLTILGMTQYIAPSITFALAIFLYQEPFDEKQLLTFALIWAGLVLFSLESLKQRRRIKHALPPQTGN